jgi:hypothetical protein
MIDLQVMSPPKAPVPSPGPDLGPEAAAEVLADWGFISRSGLPDYPGPGYLMVVLRRTPTLAHYDAESIEFWTTRDGRGISTAIDHLTLMPLETVASWGPVRIVDRLGKANQFLTFGGSLSAARVEGATVVVLLSTAPLLRAGGHSQGWDAGAQELQAWFGRLWGAAGNSRSFEASLAAADPLSRYSAFIADQCARDAYRLPGNHSDERWYRWEERRVRRYHPDLWVAGQLLRRELAVAAASDRSEGVRGPASCGERRG